MTFGIFDPIREPIRDGLTDTDGADQRGNVDA